MSKESLDIQCEHCHTTEHFKLGPDGAENIEQAVNNHIQGKTQIQAKSIIRKHSIDRQKNNAEHRVDREVDSSIDKEIDKVLDKVFKW